jgi:hypothetical protein
LTGLEGNPSFRVTIEEKAVQPTGSTYRGPRPK